YAADVARALQSVDAGDLTKALQQLNSLKKRYPKDPVVLNNLATVYMKLGQLDQAQDVLKKSMRWSPSYAPTQLTMAFTVQATGNIDLAITYAQKAISLQPAMSSAHALVGRLSFQKGDLPNAALYFAQAIELGNSDPTIREMHGMVLLNLGKTKDAFKQFTLVLQASPERPISISGLAIATALQGNPDDALKQLAKAKTKFQNDPNIERAWQSVLKIKGRK
ncbi:MAG: tetratricopeptide repeat protein, partial [Planctomycetes bacterium]|nr:tetratricopeptide repeat protein [Planctomycetota bacterium]